MHSSRPRPLIALLLACTLQFGASVGTARAQNVAIISVQSGHSIVVPAPGLSRVAIGDGRIAGVVPIGGSQILINGKAPGHTTVFAWTSSGRAAFEVTVTEQQIDDLAQMLRTSIADPNVQVTAFAHSIVVRGAVADGEHFGEVADILSRFEKLALQQKYVIVNAVTVSHPLGELQRDIANISGGKNVRVDVDGKGNVIVSGHVRDAATEQEILNQARGLAGGYLSTQGQLIDRISTDTTSQIDVKVYVLEVDDTAMKDIGLQLQSARFLPDGTYVIQGPSYPLVESPVPGGKALTTGPFFRTITLAPTLNLLLQEGHAKMLSSPNLVTLPGAPASFLVGGQIPIPYASGPQQISVEYKDFGVRLNVTPTIMGNGAINAKITPEISDLDYTNAVVESGFLIPALKVSTLSTNIITQPGESIVMGGLVRRIDTRTYNKVPLLGDIPVLGKLFRSVAYQSQHTDVVFVMTPEVITR